MKSSRLLALLNLISLLMVLVVNGLANALPINGKTTGEISGQYPNLFVPAGFTFAVWGVIYLFLIFFAIYQLIKTFRDEILITDAFGTLFILSSFLNCAWILVWHFEMVLYSLVVMIMLLLTLIAIYLRVKALEQNDIVNRSDKNNWFKVSVSVPFSLYLGWICIATIANVTAVLVDVGWRGFGLAETFWTFLMIMIGAGLALYFLVRFKDFIVGLVVIWAFYGITSKLLTAKNVIHWSLAYLLIICMVIIASVILLVIFRKTRTT